MASSVFAAGGGSGGKKIAIGARYTDTVQSIYATFLSTSVAGFAQASGNGIKLNESGKYAVVLLAGCTLIGATESAALTITGDGIDTVSLSKTGRAVDITWTGRLPVGSVVTGSGSVTGGRSNIHNVTLMVVKL